LNDPGSEEPPPRETQDETIVGINVHRRDSSRRRAALTLLRGEELIEDFVDGAITDGVRLDHIRSAENPEGLLRIGDHDGLARSGPPLLGVGGVESGVKAAAVQDTLGCLDVRANAGRPGVRRP
jgi:hypothetical protein